MSMEDFEDMDIKALTLIQLSISNEVLREVAKEKKTVGLLVEIGVLIHDLVGDKSIVVEEQTS